MEPHFDWDRVRALPDVAAVGLVIDASVDIEGIEESDSFNSKLSIGDADMTRTVERLMVLAGRLGDPARADEAMITPEYAERHHVHVGDTITARLPMPRPADDDPAATVASGQGRPRQPLRIVGVIRAPSGSAASMIMMTRAFTLAYHATMLRGGGGDDIGLVRLTHGESGLADFQRRLAHITGRTDIQVANLVQDARGVKTMTGFESNALLAFALAVLLATAVVLGQAVTRHAAASAPDLRVLRILGMSRQQATAAAVAAPALAATAGVLVGATAALGASGLFPIGTATGYEPAPGTHADLSVFTATAALAVVTVGVAAAFGAWRVLAGQRSTTTARRSVIAATAHTLGLPVPVVFGIRLALEPGRGPVAVPVRPALAGTVVGVLGVLGALTFYAGVADTASNPPRFGQTYQVMGWFGVDGVDFIPAASVWRAFTTDPDVVAINDTPIATATVNDHSVWVSSYRPVAPSRPLPVVTLSGRMPGTPGEIALGPDIAQQIGAAVGDTLPFTGTRRVLLRVTGIAFVPDEAGGYAKGAWITGDGFGALFPGDSFAYHQIHVALRPHADAGTVIGRVTAALGRPANSSSTAPFGFLPAELPRQAQQLRNILTLPLILGCFLALLAAAATVHALVTTVRRRRFDLAILRALGITPRQSGLLVITQATTLALTGLAIGVPLGIALGRTVWRAVTNTTPVLYVPPAAQLALALIVPTVLTAAVMLAALPARHAARIRVADTLRTE
jgi:ABC-type lipoprotein release transport system permease subunit